MSLPIDPFAASVISIVALALLGLPIGHAMIASSILYLMMRGMDLGTAAEQMLNGLFSSWILLAVPLFILAAELMNAGAMTLRLLAFCNAFVGRFRGGLALVNVVQSVIFAGMSGSAIADAAGAGKLMQKMMTEGGKYPPAFAAALTASSAVIGPIIPPSIPVVIYALVSDASIGYLFLAGVVPGLVMGLMQAGLIVGVSRRRAFPVEAPVPARELPRITLTALPALLMPAVLLGGIYGGATTPTEAAAVAALYALLVSAFLYRSITPASLYASLSGAARTTISIGMLIAGAIVYNYVVTLENIPSALSAWLAGYDLSPLAFLLMVNLILLVLGCLLEGTTILLVVVPVFIPTASALGIDLVHFGIVCVVNIMLGLITPPYGLLLFVMASISGQKLNAIVREVLPFLVAMLLALGLITFFPGLSLWLPRLFGYQG
ncbi:MAG: TRAP transporter large permease [Albimonas sp.]|uniref:TRAP transporter large permease n=1 Tax=Albimonas sp. TaxID=1872425 RepID=UPI0040568FF4